MPFYRESRKSYLYLGYTKEIARLCSNKTLFTKILDLTHKLQFIDRQTRDKMVEESRQKTVSRMAERVSWFSSFHFRAKLSRVVWNFLYKLCTFNL